MKSILIADLEKLALEISSLHRAGVPVSEGLQKLSTEMSSSRFSRLAEQVAKGLEEGKSLAQAMANCNPSPPKDFIALVECAEAAGDFHQAIEIIVEHARRHRIHQAMVTTALIYPLTLLLFCGGIFYLVATFVLPMFRDIFDRLGAELPFLTTMIMNVGAVFSGGLGILLLLIFAAPVLAFLYVPTIRGCMFRLMTIIPIYRTIVGTSDTVVLSRFMALMLERNVDPPRILAVAANAVWDPRTSRQIREMKERAEQGLAMADALPDYMPATAAWIFKQGEQRGQLMIACRSISELCEDRFNLINRRVIVALEPFIIVIVTVALSIMVIGLYIPIFSIPKLIGG
ncbi:MAG: type II secretion system F family protein [Candidatus Sumerlaeia bacterium]|nr:type II secretion system F family protein [Candidatus Sumerlaeia bacterium]